MINLLPREQQREIRAARTNTLLLRYLILLIGAMLFLLGALGVTYFSLASSARQADSVREQNERAAAGYQETQIAATALRSELSSVKSLFESEIRYSKVLLRLSALLPVGTSIESFSIDNTSFSQPVTLSVYVNGEQQARQLEQNFQNSPYTTGVSMTGISVNSDGQGYTVGLVFTFDRSITQ